MATLTVSLPEREYDIEIERGILSACGQLSRPLLRGRKIVIVTDSTVGPLYGAQVAQSYRDVGFEVVTCTVPAGEKSKSAAMLARLWEQMAGAGITRTDCVVALGGGVVGDLAGFAAATILRGVDFIQIPTTLLAQVDSSVGGKVAIDLEAGKNLAGAFYQPKLVMMDPNVLDSLPDRVFSDGMAEVIKYGCICDGRFFDLLGQLGSRAAVMEQIDDVLTCCCACKRQVVEQDEHDTGMRMILNFGHTAGHVYEQAYHYETYTHGEGVAAGMVIAATLGERLHQTPAGTAMRICTILKQFGLPTQISCPMEAFEQTLKLDKKSDGSQIAVILLAAMGQAVTHKMEKTALLAQLEKIQK
ncbi:MAG: 3-dehydroquinate synthase [Oscillospiraceae bacterium]|nr:3-dehydroquinate synthase [Oscillospiraceae bacterium]